MLDTPYIILCALLAFGLGSMFLCMLWYRLPSGKPREIYEGEVLYKMVDLDFSLRTVCERYLGNRALYLVDSPRFYVRQRDLERLWPEFPGNMLEKNYTMKARLSVRPLLFGGYGLARVEFVGRIEGEPAFQK